MRVLFGFLTFGVFCCGFNPIGVGAQTTPSSPGPKFVTAGDPVPSFEIAPRREQDPCHSLAEGDLRFCFEDTGWILERERNESLPTLYRLSETTTASITVRPMQNGASHNMTSDALADVVRSDVFDNPPRSPRISVKEISEKRDPSGRLTAFVTVTTNRENEKELLQVTIFKMDQHLAIVETSTILNQSDEPNELNEDQYATHRNLLKAMRVSTSLRVRANN